MSKVTINDIYTTCNEIDYDDFDTYRTISPIEIVPRKMVEMIIAECNSQISDFRYNPSVVNTAAHIKEYTESLLKQFEED